MWLETDLFLCLLSLPQLKKWPDKELRGIYVSGKDIKYNFEYIKSTEKNLKNKCKIQSDRKVIS